MQLLRYPDSGHIHPYPTGEDLLDRSIAPFRIWLPDQPILVLGASQDPTLELQSEAVAADGTPVYQRRGGGGAVLLSPGCVCVGLRLRRRPGFDTAGYFAAGNGFLSETLHYEFGLQTEPRGLSDLAWNQRKVAGSSLYLPRDCALYLASLLIRAPLALWDRQLRQPSREPDYRQGRSHRDFACNVAETPGCENVTPATVKKKMEDRIPILQEMDWPAESAA